MDTAGMGVMVDMLPGRGIEKEKVASGFDPGG